jgi:hypothetical protein
MRGYRMACCDVHVIDFEVVRETGSLRRGYFTAEPVEDATLRVVMVPRRDNRATAQMRRIRVKS